MPYTFVDVETPNGHNRRICSIGVVRTDDHGRIEDQQHFLVNPEEPFAPRNIEIHGIRPDMVKDSPTFGQLWPKLQPLFEGSTLVAHGARFDLSVLAKCFEAYGIAPFDANYFCTRQLAELHRVPVLSFALPEVCAHFGIDVPQHHDALVDALACAQLFRALAADGCECSSPSRFDFHLGSHRDRKASAAARRAVVSATAELLGVISGVSADRVYNDSEVVALRKWIFAHEDLRNTHPLNKVIPAVEVSLIDGILTLSEAAYLIDLITPYVEDADSSLATVTQQKILGLLRGVRADDVINIDEATTVLKWLDRQDPALVPNFAQLQDTLRLVVADGVITAEENAQLLAMFARLLDPAAQGDEVTTSSGTHARSAHSGPLDVAGKAVVLTGDFTFGSKSEVKAYIIEHGGEIKTGVSKSVDLVIQGEKGSQAYAFGNYGTKIRKAMELQDKGHHIQIVKESALFGTTDPQ